MSAVRSGGAETASQIRRRTPFDFYGPRVAASDLRSYRTTGPRPWTKALVSAFVADGVTGATVLDIDGGVGVIGCELLDAGAASVTNIEASAAYLAAAAKRVRAAVSQTA
jgi:16S rRNA G966 N2-methylase RsmD